MKFSSAIRIFRAHVLIVRRAKLRYTVSGIITPIGVMIPETVQYNFALLTMSTCARNMYRLEINLLKNKCIKLVDIKK